MNCPACGATLPDTESRFCRACGHAIAPPEIPCAACGAANKPDARFCRACGHDPRAAAPTATRPCPTCGADNPEGRRFCKACGHALNAAAAPIPESTIATTAINTATAATEPGPEPVPESPAEGAASAGQATTPAEPDAVVVPDEATAMTPTQPESIPSSHASPDDAASTVASVETASTRPRSSSAPLAANRRSEGVPAAALLIGILLLLAVAGFAAYFLWPNGTPVAGDTESSDTATIIHEGEPETDAADDESATRDEPGETATPPDAGTDSARTIAPPTVPPPAAAPERPIRPAARQPAEDEPKSRPRREPAEIDDEPAYRPAREPAAEPRRAREPEPVQTAPARKPEAESIPEQLARMCSREGNAFARKICEEQMRLRLCSGKWGEVPGCPKFESSNPFNH
jgi:hypothetical protein